MNEQSYVYVDSEGQLQYFGHAPHPASLYPSHQYGSLCYDESNMMPVQYCDDRTNCSTCFMGSNGTVQARSKSDADASVHVDFDEWLQDPDEVINKPIPVQHSPCAPSPALSGTEGNRSPSAWTQQQCSATPDTELSETPLGDQNDGIYISNEYRSMSCLNSPVDLKRLETMRTQLDDFEAYWYSLGTLPITRPAHDIQPNVDSVGMHNVQSGASFATMPATIASTCHVLDGSGVAAVNGIHFLPFEYAGSSQATLDPRICDLKADASTDLLNK